MYHEQNSRSQQRHTNSSARSRDRKRQTCNITARRRSARRRCRHARQHISNANWNLISKIIRNHLMILLLVRPRILACAIRRRRLVVSKMSSSNRSDTSRYLISLWKRKRPSPTREMCTRCSSNICNRNSSDSRKRYPISGPRRSVRRSSSRNCCRTSSYSTNSILHCQ